MMNGKLYFAYGSNINLTQMAFRCPAATVVGPVTLDNYELLFRGNAGGSGVATIAPQKGSTVYGLLWKITPGCEQSLDRYEGYPHLYEKQDITVRDRGGQEYTVMAYVMTKEWSRDPALPSDFYYQGIREGFRQNGLPVPELKKAWEHAAREVHAATERINTSFSGTAKPPRRRDRHER